MKKTLSLLLILLVLLACGCERGPKTPEVSASMRLVGMDIYSDDGSGYRKSGSVDITPLPEGGFTKTDRNLSGVRTMETDYDALGRRIALRVYAENGESVTSDLRYSFDGESDRVTLLLEYREQGLIFRTETTYDERGNAILENMVSDEDYDGTFEPEHVFRYAYEYDGEGRIARKEFSCEQQPSMDAVYVYEYDAAGNLLKQAQLRYDREYYVTVWTYDEHGSKLTERYSEDGETKRMADWAYTYDAAGRILETLSGDGSGVSNENYRTRRVNEYDEWGNCLRSCSYEPGVEEPVSSTVYTLEFAEGQLAAMTLENRSYLSQNTRTVFRYEEAEGDQSARNRAILTACGYQVEYPAAKEER